MAREDAPIPNSALSSLGRRFSGHCTSDFLERSIGRGLLPSQIKWFEFVSVDSTNQRRYRLGEERMLSVH